MGLIVPICTALASLVLLVWSADKFISGASVTARLLGMSPLLIGMLIVGYGTSTPELFVSAISAWQGNPAMALGNAYGSNIVNIALILGLTALIHPIQVHSRVLRLELPILVAVTVVSILLLRDGDLELADALILTGLAILLTVWSLWQSMRAKADRLGPEVEESIEASHMQPRQALAWLIAGLLLMLVSSRGLVWAAVEISSSMGVSDLVIGLTVVAIGTSLPELASSIIATRRGEHDLAIGNILGSNLFNTLAVVGLSGLIRPFAVDPAVMSRDLPVMTVLTLLLFVFGYALRIPGKGRLNRFEGFLLLSMYIGYTVWLVLDSLPA